MKDELGGKIMTEAAALRQTKFSYLTNDNDQNEKVKSTEKCVIKQSFVPNTYVTCDDKNPVWINENIKSKIKSFIKYSFRKAVKKLIFSLEK